MNMNFLSIFLQASAAAKPNMFAQLFPLILIVVIFYFFMIRPQMKKQKEIRQFRESLQKGDKVLTVGGIYGKIVELKDTAVILEIADNVRIKVDKSGLVKDNSDVNAPAK